MARSFTLELGPHKYSFVETGGDGEVSTIAEYGRDPAVLVIDGDIYYCWMEDEDEENPTVFEVASVNACETEYVDLESDEEAPEGSGPVLVEAEEEESAG